MRILFIFSVMVNIFAAAALCADIPAIEAFNAKDRILIFAPHPDDEIIATGGVIQRALAAGAKVKVVLYTNGESNELAFIAYEKRIVFKQKALLHMGDTRHNETVNACSLIGLDENDIFTLGYPDFGTMEIFTKYWGDVKPFRSMLPRVTSVSYPRAVSYGSLFVGENILSDIKKVIREFKPNKIFVSHPVDTNRDHKALYLFTRVALWDLEREGMKPQLYSYLIHVVGWPKKRGYYPELELKPFYKLAKSPIEWRQLVLTHDEVDKKRAAILLFPSQNQPTSRYLLTFARKNELFGDYPEIILKHQPATGFIWHNVGEPDRYTRISLTQPHDKVSAVSYALAGEHLLVRLITKVPLSKNFGVLVYLIGYSKERGFDQMPKISLSVNAGGLHVRDGLNNLPTKGIMLKYQGNQLIFKIPLSVLGYPDRIMACPRISMGKLPLDKIAWRILRLE